MDTNRLNRWLTLGANFGVLFGIILLVVELDQNRDMIRAKTRSDISQQISEFLSQVANNAELSSIKRRAEAGEELTADEEFRYGLHWGANIRFWENIHYQYRQGLFDEAEFSAERTTWRRLIVANQRFESIWCQTRGRYSADFILEVERLIVGEACSETEK